MCHIKRAFKRLLALNVDGALKGKVMKAKRSAVGSDDGSNVGSHVGSDVGSAVGSDDGSDVGSDVGSAVGSVVGSDDGSLIVGCRALGGAQQGRRGTHVGVHVLGTPL